jgi:hypothetical protein
VFRRILVIAVKGLLADLRHAARLYGRSPVASVLVIVVLSVAMAFVAALLSLYVDLLLRPHPGFERGQDMVTFGWTDGRNAGGLPWFLIDRIAEESATLQAAAGTVPTNFMVGPDQEQLIGEAVTREFFPGVRPRLVLGRGFESGEHDADAESVVVISDRYWRSQFGARLNVLGETLPIFSQMSDGTTESNDFRIIGVMGPNFTGTLPPQNNLETDIWLPAEQALAILFASAGENAPPMDIVRTQYTLRGMGRRANGASSPAIMEELNSRFLEDLPDFTGRPGLAYEVLDGLVFNAPVQRNTERQLTLMLGSSILLSLVAAANVSLFLLARAPGRRRELGIRMAVGAQLKRLTRQLASEATLLVAVAAIIGIAVSIWLAEFLRNMSFLQAAQWSNVTLLDWRVLGLVGVFLLVLTLLVSVAPILGIRKPGCSARNCRSARCWLRADRDRRRTRRCSDRFRLVSRFVDVFRPGL